MSEEHERSDASVTPLAGPEAVGSPPPEEEVIVDLDEGAQEEETPEGEARPQPKEAEPEEEEEFEFNGSKHKIPKKYMDAVRPGLMMQADYTRKTQELAETRQALIAEREQQAALSEERITKIGAYKQAEEMIQRYHKLDWDQLEAQDWQLAQKRQRELLQWQNRREHIAQEIRGLDQQVQQVRYQAAMEAQGQVLKRIQEAGDVYRRDIPTWKDDVQKVVQFGLQQGYTPAQMGLVPERPEEALLTDVRFGKLLHRAWQADELARKQQAAAQKRTQPASQAEPLQQVKPKGGGPSPRVSMEGASMDQYVAMRKAQMQKKAMPN